MASSINDTVTEALRTNGLGQYTGQAAPIVQALVEREQKIAAELITFATDQGLGADEATRVFQGVGMSTPTQAAAAQAAPQGDLGDLVRDLANSVKGLVAFAKQNGYRGQ